jgi:hypothetical protein
MATATINALIIPEGEHIQLQMTGVVGGKVQTLGVIRVCNRKSHIQIIPMVGDETIIVESLTGGENGNS